MTDITMCDNPFCKLNTSCYRYTATPNKHQQTYFIADVRNEDESCNYFQPENVKEL